MRCSRCKCEPLKCEAEIKRLTDQVKELQIINERLRIGVNSCPNCGCSEMLCGYPGPECSNEEED